MPIHIKTWLYLILLSAVAMYLGSALAGRQGLLLAFVISFTINLVSYFYSDRLILWTYGAQLIEGIDPYGLQNTVTKLCEKIGIPKPKVYIIKSDTPNAFAVGRSPLKASVAATEGILTLLSREEIEGVLAHELSHINHKDTLIMMVAATLGSFVMYLANSFKWVVIFGKENKNQDKNMVGQLFLAFFSPIAAFIIHLAVSRNREFIADQEAAEMTQNPHALASALWKLHNYSFAKPLSVTQATAHMFIVNPLSLGGLNGLFSTHPPVEERIKKLIGRTL
ncbi:MAG: M48 family metalloprotease [Oligoflexia bacterium]|nr:M48 family metalloprotease [Oligoflexia bacterium]